MKNFLLTCTLLFVACAAFAGAPVIASFSPASGPAGTLVTISGSGLDNPTSLTIGGIAAIPVSNTGSKLVAMVMPGATTGPVGIATLSGSSTGPGTFAVTAATYPKYQIGGKIFGNDAASYAEFGDAIAISADGNTAAIGGFNDNQVGGVWIFVRNGAAWVQQGNKILPSDYIGYYIGSGVALSADGNTMVMTGNLGAWIYTRSNGIWTQQTNLLTGSSAIPYNEIATGSLIARGYAAAINADGSTILIANSSDGFGKGAMWAYHKEGAIWVQQGNKIMPADLSGGKNAFGYSIAMSADGSTAVVGAPGDNNFTGSAYIFTNTAGAWAQQGNKITAADNLGAASHGAVVAITANGNMAIVGGPGDGNNGIGAAWVYVRTGGTWAQQAKLVSPVSSAQLSMSQGNSLAVNADGTALLVSSTAENNVGAIWTYARNGSTWGPGNKLAEANNIGVNSMALSADGTSVLMGNIIDNNVKGSVSAFSSLPYPTLVTTDAANITTTTATIGGRVDGNGSPATVTLEYGTSPDLTASITAGLTTGTSPVAAGGGTAAFTSNLAGLSPGATYYYRINGTNATGSNAGTILSFLTLTPPVLSSFEPMEAGAGSTVILTGVNLINITAVSIGGVPASFAQASSTSVYATVGKGAASGSVSVTNDYGTALLPGFKLTVAPDISYPAFPTLDITKTIVPVSPVNKGGAVPDAPYLQVTTPVYQNLNGGSWSFYVPVASTIDPLGNIYIADGTSVKKLSPNGQVATYANQANNSANSTINPSALAIDQAGNILLTDRQGNRILKITSPARQDAELFAGSGVKGSADGIGVAASFNNPVGLVFDKKGDMYVADQGNNLIRKITPAGVVSTFAGSGKTGATNGTGVNASFNAPAGLAIDAADNLYVADKGNNAIRRISPAGIVTTVAGTGVAGASNGKADTATFSAPTGLAIDKSNNIYVADAGNKLVRMINTAGIVSTAAGNLPGFNIDGIGTAASFRRQSGLMCDLKGNLIICDSTNVRKMVITGYAAAPALPPGLAIDGASGTITGTPLSITNSTYTINAINVNGTATTTVKITTVIPPVPPGIKYFTPYICKVGTKITITGFNVLGATGVTIGGVPVSSFTVVSASTITAEVPPGATSGSIAVSNPYGSTAAKGLIITNPPQIAYNAVASYSIGTAITPITVKNSGGGVPNNIYLQATTFAGSGQPGLANGPDSTASFTFPTNTVADGLGNIYVSETSNYLIRKITPEGVVSTFAGSGAGGSDDGNGAAASFNYPNHLATDAANNLYVTDGYDNGSIRKITPSGMVSTLARGISSAGLTVMADGTVYVVDTRNDAIRKITPDGVVSNLAGGPVAGYQNGQIGLGSVLFDHPIAIVSDPAGDLFIADSENYRIREISAAGLVSDLSGSGQGYTDGPPASAKFTGMNALAIDGAGNLYLPDFYNGVIRKVAPAGEVSTLIGNGLKASVNGIGKGVALQAPQDISIDVNGNIYFADINNYTIRKIATTGFSITPELPAGLTIDGSGIISGIPTVITPATTYTVTAYNIGGSGSTTINFSTVATKVPPVVSSFSPTTGAVGTLVTITGSNLNYPTVKIGGVDALVVSNTGTELKCLVMPNAVSGNVSVSTTAGSVNGTGSFKVKATPYPNVQQGKKFRGDQGNIGTSMAISADGNTILTVVESANNPAAVFFTRKNGVWTAQKAGLTALDKFDSRYFSLMNTVALSADGSTAAIGMPYYSLSYDGQYNGAVFVFVKEKGAWRQQGLRLSGTGAVGSTIQGSSMAISADGNTIIEGSPDDNHNQGAAWVFTRSNGVWAQQGPKLVGADNTVAAHQGYSVNISADGNTAILGGNYDNDAAGAAWIFTRAGSTWAQQGPKLTNPADVTGSGQGSSVALSADGNTAIVGASGISSGANVFVRTGTTWSIQGPKLVGTGYFSNVEQGHAVAISADGNTATMAGLISGFTVSANQSLLWVFTRTGGKWAPATSIGPNDFENPNSNTNNNYYTVLTPDGSTAVMNTEFQQTLWAFIAAAQPTATTQAATSVTGTSATLNGLVNDGGLTATVTIEYGTSPILAGAITATLTTGVSPVLPGAGDVGFTSNLTGLLRGATYYFRIKAESGSTAVSGDILSFTTASPPPAITSFTPSSAITGTEVAITGTGFTAASEVSFGGTPAASFKVVSPTSITAKVAAGASGNVRVVAPSGSAALAGFTYIFTLPANNFTIAAVSAGCRGSANGSITIAAAQPLNYTVTIIGGSVNSSYPFTNTKTINNLAAGTYNLCFTVAGQNVYSQCFTIVITEPKDLAVYAAVNKVEKNVTLTLDGGNIYYITLNGTTLTTTNNTITLALGKGSNDITIATDKPCQGTLIKKLILSADLAAFPNPFTNTLNVNVGPDNLKTASLQLYNMMGTRIYSQQFSNISGVVTIDPGNLMEGTYTLKVVTGQTEKIIKVVKK